MINKELLIEMVEGRWVNVQKHPEADLWIYQYSQSTQYERNWNEVTKQCRGLILDKDYNIVAKPFSKFHNIEEHLPEEIPNLPFDVYEKMDGSCGIGYFLNDKIYIATKGSFTSDQAIHANHILYTKYNHLVDKLDKNKTYVWEIIYPENRIVCNYGNMDDLILLSIIDNKTGEETLEDIGFPIVKKYDGINDINSLKQLEENNKEGFVVKFSNNFRIKVKFSEYCRLHRIVTGVSNITIWEYLSQGKPFDELIDRVPDEFYDWVKQTKEDLENKYNSIRKEVDTKFYELVNRKEYSEKIKNEKYMHLLFGRLNSYSAKHEKAIWDMIRSDFSKPFSNIEQKELN